MKDSKIMQKVIKFANEINAAGSNGDRLVKKAKDVFSKYPSGEWFTPTDEHDNYFLLIDLPQAGGTIASRTYPNGDEDYYNHEFMWLPDLNYNEVING